MAKVSAEAAKRELIKRKRRRRRNWKRGGAELAADLGWKPSCWSLNPPQDQRSRGLKETSRRSLQKQGAAETEREEKRETCGGASVIKKSTLTISFSR